MEMIFTRQLSKKKGKILILLAQNKFDPILTALYG
jgi:hypothetical protein